MLLFMAAILILAALGRLPESEPTNAPPWVAPWAAVVVLLIAAGVLLPQRPAIVAFSLAFVLAALFTVTIPFSPGPLASTIEMWTPFGYFSERLGDRPTRTIAAVVAVFTVALIAVGISAALQDEFGERRWLMTIQGIGLLFVLPLVFALIALMLVLLSPYLLWRRIEVLREKKLAE